MKRFSNYRNQLDILRSRGLVVDNRNQDITTLISLINKEISDKYNRNESITHYLHEYSYIPLWVLTNIMSFGNISKFYSVMKLSDQNDVAREFNLRPEQLDSILKSINVFRNKCAHEERLYNIYVKFAIDNFPHIHGSLGLPRNSSGNYIKGKNDLFSLLISLKLLLLRSEFNQLVSKLKREIDSLNGNFHTILPSDITDKMGFPSNWYNIKRI